VKQKGDEMTLSGLSASKEVKLAQDEQKLKVKKENASATGEAEFTIGSDTASTLKLKPATATTLKFKAQIEKADKKGEKAIPKVKASGVSGVTVKASQLDDQGNFDVTVDIKAFKGEPTGTIKLAFSYESLKDIVFDIVVSKKG
jgi:hypothetical protein